MELEEVEAFADDLQTPDTPGCDEPNAYGRVVRKAGNLRVRFSGEIKTDLSRTSDLKFLGRDDPTCLWSLWAGPKLITANKDLQNVLAIYNKALSATESKRTDQQ